ncbi:MAG TPA: hypothetical protein VGF24_20635 [Vicinamibacterales bacterium]
MIVISVPSVPSDVTLRDAYHDGGASFLVWDGARRSTQHAADAVRRAIPLLASKTPAQLGRRGSSLLRGRIAKSRTGTLPIDVVKRIVTEAGTLSRTWFVFIATASERESA